MNAHPFFIPTKLISALSGACFLTLSTAQAETLKEHYATYCQSQIYDSKGSSSPIKQDIAQTLTKLRLLIHATGKKYGVDPRAIAGSILAEHSMNTNATDIAENFLVKIGAAPTGEVFGKKFTYGFGQLHFERAKAAELIAASVENRAIYSDHEISQNILTPEGSINYIGALIKQAQDIYKAGGFDISADTAVTTTLYNIGKVQERLVRTKKENRTPGPNYFGCFVAAHISEIESIIGPPPKVEVAHFDEAPAPQTEAKKTENRKVTKAPQAEPTKALPSVQYYVTSRELKLSNGPKDCYDEPMFPVDNRPAASGSQLKLIGKAVDCDLKPWVLVRSADGTSGWIDKKELQNASSMKSFAAESCSLDQPTDCKTKLQKTYATFFRDEKQNGELNFSMRSANTVQKELETIDYSKALEHISKLSPEQEKEYQAYQKFKPLTESEIKELDQAIKDYRERIRVSLNLDDAEIDNGAKNPYFLALRMNPLYGRVKTYLNYRNQGLSHDDLGKYGLSIVVDLDAVKDFFKNAPTSPKPTAKQLQTLLQPESQDIRLNLFSSEDLQTQIRLLNPKNDFRRLLESLDTCQSVFAKYPKIYGQYLTTRAELLDTKGSSDVLKQVVNAYFLRNGTDGKVSLSEACLSIQFLDQNPEVSAQPKSDCELTVLDTTAEVAKALKMPLNTAAELLKTPESREAMLFAALNPLSTVVENALGRSLSQPTSLRELAKALAAESCVKSVYVPEPWLATPDKTTYRPNKSNTVSVDYATETCSKATGAK